MGPIFLVLSQNILHSRQTWKQSELSGNLKHYCVCDWKHDFERCEISEKLGACSVWRLMMLCIQMPPVSYFGTDPISRSVLLHNVYPVIPHCQPKNQNSQQPTCLQLFYLLISFQEAVIYCQYKTHWLIDRWKKRFKNAESNIKQDNKGVTPWSFISFHIKLLRVFKNKVTGSY